MRQRLLTRHMPHLRGGLAEKRAAGRGQDDFRERIAMRGLRALEDGRMLGVDRQDLNTFVARRAHDQPTRAHERFLVRQRDVLARVDRGQRRQQADHTDDCGHNDIRARLRRTGGQAVHAGQHLDIRIREFDLEVARRLLLAGAHHFGTQRTRLLLK